MWIPCLYNRDQPNSEDKSSVGRKRPHEQNFFKIIIMPVIGESSGNGPCTPFIPCWQ